MLETTNSNLLGEDFALFVHTKLNRIRPAKKIDIIPTELPSGDRLEDEFGGSARYPAFDEMNDFGSTQANIFSVGDYDYETTPYGYYLKDNNSNADGTEEYSNFRFLGIGKESEKQKERREARKKKRAASKEERKKMKLGKRIVNVLNKYNPAVAVPRSSALVGMRFNIFGISSRLYPALLTEEELKAKNFNLENAAKAKKAFEKVAKTWTLLGGATPSLEQAIRKGHSKPIFNTKKAKARKAKEEGKKGFDGEEYSSAAGADDGAILTYVSAGLGILGTLIGIIKSVGAKRNPYNDNSPEARQFDDLNAGIDDTAPEPNEAELNKLQDLAKRDLDKGLGLDEGTGELESDDILGIPKTAFWIGLGVIALVGGYFVYSKLIKKK